MGGVQSADTGSSSSSALKTKPMTKEELQKFRQEREGNIDELVSTKLPGINKKILTRFAKLQREHYNASEWTFKYTLPIEDDIEVSAGVIVNQIVSTLSTELEDYKVEAFLGEELEVSFKISLLNETVPSPTPQSESQLVAESVSSSSSEDDSSS